MLKIQDILRAGDTTRWNIVHTSKTSTVAEHQYNVAMIVKAIARNLGCPDSEMVAAALEHDLDEVIMGDIPSPTKERARKLGMELNDLKIHPRPKLSEEEEQILKIADIMENAWFVANYGIGRHAERVAKEMETKLHSAMSHLPATTFEAVSIVWFLMTKGEFVI